MANINKMISSAVSRNLIDYENITNVEGIKNVPKIERQIMAWALLDMCFLPDDIDEYIRDSAGKSVILCISKQSVINNTITIKNRNQRVWITYHHSFGDICVMSNRLGPNERTYSVRFSDLIKSKAFLQVVEKYYEKRFGLAETDDGFDLGFNVHPLVLQMKYDVSYMLTIDREGGYIDPVIGLQQKHYWMDSESDLSDSEESYDEAINKLFEPDDLMDE